MKWLILWFKWLILWLKWLIFKWLILWLKWIYFEIRCLDYGRSRIAKSFCAFSSRCSSKPSLLPHKWFILPISVPIFIQILAMFRMLGLCAQWWPCIGPSGYMKCCYSMDCPAFCKSSGKCWFFLTWLKLVENAIIFPVRMRN